MACVQISIFKPKQIQNKHVLLQPHPSQPIQLAKVHKQGSGFVLQARSEVIPYSPTIIIWGVVGIFVPMSSLMPLIGTTIPIINFSTYLGISETPTETFQNIDGHSFLILKTQAAPDYFEHEPGFVFAFQKRRKYFLYLGLWYWNGTSWEIDSSFEND